MQDDKDLVAVASFDTMSEAEVARSILESEGIDVVLQDQPLAALLPPVALANGGLVLLVSPDEQEHAREALAAPDLAEVEAGAAVPPDGGEAEGPREQPEASGDGAGI